MTTSPARPSEINDFWFGPGFSDGSALEWPPKAITGRWFVGSPVLDAEITTRFGAQVEAALNGGLTEWEAAPHDRLALITLLDQFTRNVFRASPRAFAGDARAQALTLAMLRDGSDATLPWAGCVFARMPLMHAEDLALQEVCVREFKALQGAAPAYLRGELQGNVDAAHEHHELIARFGRFPHRNAVMGRANTAAEEEYLVHARRFGQ